MNNTDFRNGGYKPDEMYTMPYSEKEQNEMTEACFMEMMKVIKETLDKHFKDKLMSPKMFNHMFVPLVTVFLETQFGVLPKPIKQKVYVELLDDFVFRLTYMVRDMGRVDKEIEP